MFSVPAPEIAVQPPKVVISPPGNVFMVHTVYFGHFILRKIIHIVGTRCHIADINAPNSTLAGALPQTPLGKLTALPRPASWI